MWAIVGLFLIIIGLKICGDNFSLCFDFVKGLFTACCGVGIELGVMLL